MIDEKKLIEELEKWMNDTAYLKEKYSGATQFKDGTGENIMYAHAEIAHDVISEVIDKINEQQKFGEWIPCSERLPENDDYILLSFENFSLPLVGRYDKDGEIGGAFYIGDCDGDDTCVANDLFVNAWQPLPEPYKQVEE